MKSELISGLENCGFVNGATIMLQGTLAPDSPYPDNFITIWTDYTADHSHFDNVVKSVEWHFTVILYSIDPDFLKTKSNEIIKTLRGVGFIPQGKGQDIPSDEATHTGWAMEFIRVEKLI